MRNEDFAHDFCDDENGNDSDNEELGVSSSFRKGKFDKFQSASEKLLGDLEVLALVSQVNCALI